MKLIYWNAEKEFGPGHFNFGDDLNKLLWNEHLPGFFDGHEDVLFYGIGTILSPSIPAKPLKLVMGSGARGDQKLKPDRSYDIAFVRGPRTAAMIGNSVRYICDPAILVATLPLPQKTSKFKFGYMPHVRQHLAIGPILEQVCKQKCVSYISPDDQPEVVIEQMLQVETMICEAMHGAIVSDALGIPWLPVFTRFQPHSFKWQDWAESMEVRYKPMSMRDYSLPLRKMKVAGTPANFISEVSFTLALDRVTKKPEPWLSDASIRHRKINQILDTLEEYRKKYAGVLAN